MELAGEVVDVGLHVKVAVAAQVAQDRPALSLLLAAKSLPQGNGQGVGRLGRRNDALLAGEARGRLEDLELVYCDRLDLAELDQVGDQRTHAVVAQAPGVYSGGHEATAQGVHLDQRCHMRDVAEVVHVGALGHGRTRGGLDRDEARAVLNALLDKYAAEGIGNIESLDVLRVPPINHLGTPIEIVKLFGGKEDYLSAINELEQELYSAA